MSKVFYVSILICCFGFCINVKANQYYVAVTGSSSGDGSIANPWDLQTALNQPATVNPNDTIWLRNGIYVGHFTSQLTGIPGSYIYVIQYPNERATLQDNRQFASGATLQINGAWTIYKDFEVMNNNANRNSTGPASFRPMGIQVDGPETKFINLVIHDVGHGFGFWEGAQNAEIYGCLIYNCGINNVSGTYSTHGHGIYTQNNTGIKMIKDNLIFNQFGFGLHLYPNPGNLNGYIIDGNTIYNNGILTNDTVRYNNIIVNPYPPYTAENITIQNNLTYDSKLNYTYTDLIQSDLFIGATDVNCENLIFQNNYLMGKGRAGIAILNWDSVNFTNNTTYYLNNGTLGLVMPPGAESTDYFWDNNTYYGGDFFNQFSFQYGLSTNFETWQDNTSFDASSNFYNANIANQHIIIQPNQYEQGRANIIVYNWEKLSSVTINVTTIGLTDGQLFQIRDAANFYGEPLFTGNYNSDSPEITITLNDLTPAAPIGLSPLASTAPEFAPFVVVPDNLITSINQVNWDNNAVTIFPNPVTNTVNIISRETVFSAENIKLFDIFGNNIISTSVNTILYNEGLQLNVSQLNPGFYIIQIENENTAVSYKIIKI